MSKLTLILTVPDYETGVEIWNEVGPSIADLLNEGAYSVSIDGVTVEEVTEVAE